jgi:hypothetical protein
VSIEMLKDMTCVDNIERFGGVWNCQRGSINIRPNVGENVNVRPSGQIGFSWAYV